VRRGQFAQKEVQSFSRALWSTYHITYYRLRDDSVRINAETSTCLAPVQRDSALAELCPGAPSPAKGAGAGRMVNTAHTAAEVFQFTLIYPPPLRSRCEQLIPLPGFMARSDQPHENEQSEDSEMHGEV
jgi:hypothetical protein